jgi:hypothetical protein
MEYMISTDIRTERTAPQQLTLLSDHVESKALAPSRAHARFHLSSTTRERGLAHVAEIRAKLAAAQAERDAATANPLPRRHQQVA